MHFFKKKKIKKNFCCAPDGRRLKKMIRAVPDLG